MTILPQAVHYDRRGTWIPDNINRLNHIMTVLHLIDDDINYHVDNKDVEFLLTIIDNRTKEKIGQLKYNLIGSEVEIYDTYLFPEYRQKKLMSSLIKKLTFSLKETGISIIKLKTFNEDARIAWKKMGFEQKGENSMELKI